MKKGAKEKELQIARSLLQIGISVEKINLATKLTVEEILKIQEEV